MSAKKKAGRIVAMVAGGIALAVALAFLLGFAPAGDLRVREACSELGGSNTLMIDLATSTEPGDPRPFLVFGPEAAALRRMHLEILGC